MNWTIAADLLLAALLIATIAVAVRLERRITALRRDRTELEALAGEFRQATMQAHDGIRGLKLGTAELDERVTQAHGIVDDLRFLIERGSTTADRLEGGIRDARHAPPGRPKVAANNASARADAQPVHVEPAHIDPGRILAGRTPPGHGEPGRPAPATRSAPRSDAERHLLAALQQARG